MLDLLRHRDVMRGDRLSDHFEASRPRLHALAYRMLGSNEEAEDAVQETWVRVGSAVSTEVENPGGWFTTIAARICLDRLRARRSRPESPSSMLGPDEGSSGDDTPGPEQEALMAESVEAALLVVLDRLGPAERVAFVLHDVFAVPFDEIGGIVGRTPEAARQLASRARRRVQRTSPTGQVGLVRRREIVAAFIAASRAGDFDGLLAVLDPDVVLRPDAEAVRLGAFTETRGADAVAHLMRGGAQAARLALVGGTPGVAWAPRGRIRGAIAFEMVDGRIVEIDIIGNAEHLEQLEVVLLDV
jgi:RNA polymerase sigma factor (sigma-70 family)